jgi:hypothetical protein
VEINSLTIWARDRNSYCSNTFKLHTIVNITIIVIVAVYNKREVIYNISSIIYIASINNLIINKWCINRGG